MVNNDDKEALGRLAELKRELAATEGQTSAQRAPLLREQYTILARLARRGVDQLAALAKQAN